MRDLMIIIEIMKTWTKRLLTICYNLLIALQGRKHVIKKVGTWYRLENDYCSEPLGHTEEETVKSLIRKCEDAVCSRDNNLNKGGIYKVYLNIRNPYIVDAKGRYFDNIYTDLHVKPLSASAIASLVKKMGQYDGVIIKNVRETTLSNSSPSTDYIVFSPNQIKHVLDNSGKYSDSNSSIIDEGIITEVDAEDINLKSFEPQMN